MIIVFLRHFIPEIAPDLISFMYVSFTQVLLKNIQFIHIYYFSRMALCIFNLIYDVVKKNQEWHFV